MIERRCTALREHLLYGGPVIAYACVIFFISSLSGFPISDSFFPGVDKIFHAGEYYFFGLLIYRWLNISKSNRASVQLVTILLGAGYALSDEWHQSFVPGRNASAMDLLYDVTGVVFSAATYIPILNKFKNVWTQNTSDE